MVEHVLKKRIGNDYGECDAIKEHCFYKLADIFEKARSDTQEAIFEYCLNRVNNDDLFVSSLLSDYGVGYLFSESMLVRLGECLRKNWEEKKAYWLSENIDQVQRALPVALNNLLEYFVYRKDCVNLIRF